MQKIVTFPQAEKEYQRYLVTGNEYVSIPSITEEGAIEQRSLPSIRIH